MIVGRKITLVLGLVGAAWLAGSTPAPAPAKLRGYTIMAGGLGRLPKSPSEMWPNTEKAHLEFITKAQLNLVVVEIPYGVNKQHPKSAATTRFIKKIRDKKREVWIIYPHVLAQKFNLPRQVGRDGKKIAWKCCFNNPQVQDWLVENGRAICAAYKPDGLILFGTFQVGGKCNCPACKKNKPSQTAKIQESFFLRMKGEIQKTSRKTKLGTCCFWTPPTKKTIKAIDILSPVVSIWRPGYNGPGRIKKDAMPLKRKYKKLQVVPYIKIFLATQTNSNTTDILTAAKESIKYCDGFFYWGYNPGHSYNKQEYNHKEIHTALKKLSK